MANTLTFANLTLTDANLFGGVSFLADLNTGEEFSIGNTASASVSFVSDTQLPLYTKDATNGKFTWTKDSTSRGRYFITEVTKEADRYNITAYDAMYLLDTNISALSLTFPLTVSAAASAIAAYIGCTVSGTVTNGSLSVSALDDDMTIRELLGYVAEASGCSVKIDGSDHLCFMYYADSGITITDSQYKEFGLEVADYTCAAIDKVAILNSVGATIATAGSGNNTLYIDGNPFMESATSTHASAVYAKVNGLAYAPLSCEMFEEYGLEVGTIATFGSTPTLVMHLESSEEGAVASSVGSDSRAEYNKSFETMLAEATERALDAADDASKIATNYVTDITGGGVMVHPSGDSTSGWKIADAIELLKSGVSYIWAGLVNNIATIRIGRSDASHAEIGASGIIFRPSGRPPIGIIADPYYGGNAVLQFNDSHGENARIYCSGYSTSGDKSINLDAGSFSITLGQGAIDGLRFYEGSTTRLACYGGTGDVEVGGYIKSEGAKVPTRNQICYANSRVDNFVGGQLTLGLNVLGITTGAKPVGILLTYQDGGSTPTVLRYDYDASSASGVVIKAYDSSGNAVSGNVRYFAVVFQNSWTSVT